jgi:endonuclease/exonuclease/phosphatase family metal-dependent hydrolase
MLFSTYNIHYGVGLDGRYDVGRIADTLAETDIACLQEVVRGWPQNGYADQTAEIGQRLNRYYRFHGPLEADSSTVDADGRITNRRRSFGNAIISRWPILWSRGVLLPKTKIERGYDLQRGFIEAAIAVPSGPLRIYCTHLSYVGTKQRMPQIEALTAAIPAAVLAGATWDGTPDDKFFFQDAAFDVPAAAIVAGDFNHRPQDPEYRHYLAAGLADAWRAAGNDEAEIESAPHKGRIDHVFVTPDLTPKVARAWIGRGNPASDHWPMFVEFRL